MPTPNSTEIISIKDVRAANKAGRHELMWRIYSKLKEHADDAQKRANEAKEEALKARKALCLVRR